MKFAGVSFIVLLLLLSHRVYASKNYKDDALDIVFQELQTDLSRIDISYQNESSLLSKKLRTKRAQLFAVKLPEEQMNLLTTIYQLESMLSEQYNKYISDINKVRYLKGLQIIKILYDKTLSLDHHFSTVSTLNEINKISNPNQYEDFRSVKDLLQKEQDKKTGFSLSSLLGNNIYTSVVHSLVSIFTNNQVSRSEKEKSLKNVECILDFTLRMNNDLNTIYFETAFLQKSNQTIMRDIEQLFSDYTRPITYNTSLKTCRNQDEWGIIQNNLNSYLDTLENEIENKAAASKVRNMQINLQFPIDRLLQFITQYNSFIDQGSMFYEKFEIMLNSYENEQQCASQIPVAYKTLKDNITLSISKFNTAYKPVEINGSKLKQLLYGINEYE